MAARRRSGRAGWEFAFELEPGPDGRRRQRRRSGFKTKKEAEQAERDERALIDKGVIISTEKLTTGAYLEQWLAHKKPGIEPATYVGYESHVKGHLVPALGRIELRKLRPLEIQAAYRHVVDSGRSVRTALHVHRTLHQALGQAVKWQLIPTNAAEAVDPPRPTKRVVKTPTVEELRKLLDLGDKTPHGALFRVVAMTGLRQGEALGLHWRNVYLDAAIPTLTVAEAAQRQTGKGVVFKAPKREDSARSIVLLNETVELLRAHRQRQKEQMEAERLDYADQGLVFAMPLGGPIDAGNLKHVWIRLVKRADVGHVTFHDLRHTHATLMLQAGVNLKIVQERLGHASINITADLYTHVSETTQAEAVEKLGRLMQE